MHKHYYLQGTIEGKKVYKKYANQVTHMKENAKKAYFQKRFEECSKDPKNTWKTIGEIINLTKGNAPKSAADIELLGVSIAYSVDYC